MKKVYRINIRFQLQICLGIGYEWRYGLKTIHIQLPFCEIYGYYCLKEELF